MGDYGGVEGITIEECDWCGSHQGNYSKSPHWPKKRDEEDARRVKEGMAYQHELKDVKPLKKDRRRAA
jgi:hypothetical protein